MSTFGAEDAGEGSRTPSPTSLKGLAKCVITPAGMVLSFWSEWSETVGSVITCTRFAITVLNNFEEGCIVLGL